MFGMRYAIDVVFLDDGHRVVEALGFLPPNSISPKVTEATSVLELPAGTVDTVGLAPGSQIEIESEVPAPVTSGWLREFLSVAGNVALAMFFALFAAVHFSHAQDTGQWATTAPIVVQKALLVGLFLSRRRSISTSKRPFDWAVGVVGTFLPLPLRATAEVGRFYWFGAPFQVAGFLVAILGTVGLGRSIGVVAGNRGLKVKGPYRVVRHPMYAGYLLSYLGYIAAYPSGRNVLVFVLTLAALNARAIVEERFLAREPDYDHYQQRVRWRFVPYLY